jgi:hypothetical protein
MDNPQRTLTVDLRQTIIAQVLGDGQEEPTLADILKTPQDTTDFG